MGSFAYLGYLSHPALQATLIAAASVPFLRRRRHRAAAGLLALATLWLWLCLTPAFAFWLQRGLDGPRVQTSAASFPTADAIVVLGGGDLPRDGSTWGSADSREVATRLGFGLKLFRSARADLMLLSGNDQALKMTRKLKQQGVPASALVTESTSVNTHQNALYSAALLKHRELPHILLVTSELHMRRALACFRRQGLSVTPAAVPDPDSASLKGKSQWWPRRAALSLSARCLREYLGWWAYRLRGWT